MSDQPSPAPLAVAPEIAGRMTIEFHVNVRGHLTPHISFNPVGRITPGLIYQFIPLICSSVEQEHAETRRAARAAPTAAPVVVARRRRA